MLGGRLQISGAYRAQFFALDKPRFEPATGAPFAGIAFSAPPTAQTGDASAAYTFRGSGTKFRVHAGRGYRAPSLYERFGVYFDGSSYTLFGDPRLRPDRSRSIDGGIDQTLWNSRVAISATYFYTRLNEVIAFASINTPTDAFGRFLGYYNTGGGIARGAELRSTVAVMRSLELSGAYTYTDARQRTPLTPGIWQTYDVPRHQYSFSATERFSPRWTGFFVYTGSTDYLTPIYGQAFRFGGRSRARRPQLSQAAERIPRPPALYSGRQSREPDLFRRWLPDPRRDVHERHAIRILSGQARRRSYARGDMLVRSQTQFTFSPILKCARAVASPAA